MTENFTMKDRIVLRLHVCTALGMQIADLLMCNFFGTMYVCLLTQKTRIGEIATLSIMGTLAKY